MKKLTHLKMPLIALTAILLASGLVFATVLVTMSTQQTVMALSVTNTLPGSVNVGVPFTWQVNVKNDAVDNAAGVKVEITATCNWDTATAMVVSISGDGISTTNACSLTDNTAGTMQATGTKTVNGLSTRVYGGFVTTYSGGLGVVTWDIDVVI